MDPENISSGDDKHKNDKNAGKRRVKPKKRKLTGKCWKHFEEFYDEEGVRKGRCNYCNAELIAASSSNGTSSLNKHAERCDKNPANQKKDQPSLSLTKNEDGQGTLKTWKYDPDKVKNALIKMIIVDEMPFSSVEREGFKEFVETLCPSFNLPSRFTVARHIIDLYLGEKQKLRQFFIKNDQRVCFTTDTWTSNQRINYMSLTAHFIDDNWNYQKRIINFRPILSHKGEEIARAIEDCIQEWGIKRVMTFTMDNASSNDVAIREMRISLSNLLRNGMYLHVRCLAHIMNLIVQDGLKHQGKTKDCVRNAVRYIRSSPPRLHNFKLCVSESKVKTKGCLSLDVCTRWNSTYEMLDKAISLKEGFDLYARRHSNFRSDLGVVPNHNDWAIAKKLSQLLALFEKKTENVSCSTYAVSHVFFAEVNDIREHLNTMRNAEIDTNTEKEPSDFQKMIEAMQAKFDKYFEVEDKTNKLFEFASILDPRYKLDIVKFAGVNLYDVKFELQLLYNEYESLYARSSTNEVKKEKKDDQPRSSQNSWMDRLEKSRSGGGAQTFNQTTELERYVADGVDVEALKEKNFDILRWWKVNSGRYPILSRIAKDILAIPVSTVASESAFSTGGRVVEIYRSSLSPKIVEALICTQDWIRKGRKPINDDEDLEKFDELAKDVCDKIESMGIVEVHT